MRTILTIMLALIVSVASAQTVKKDSVKLSKIVKVKNKKPAKDSSDVYKLNFNQVQLVYATLEGYKRIAAFSLDISARELNLKLGPQIDSCQRIFYNQMMAFEKLKKEKAKADSLKKAKSK